MKLSFVGCGVAPSSGRIPEGINEYVTTQPGAIACPSSFCFRSLLRRNQSIQFAYMLRLRKCEPPRENIHFL